MSDYSLLILGQLRSFHEYAHVKESMMMIDMKPSSMNQPVIALREVSKTYEKHTVIHPTSFSVQKGDMFGMLGPSGSGKTTTIKLMIGMEQPDTGEVITLGTKLPNLQVFQRIGYMAQSDALYHELSAYENVDFFASLYGLKDAYKKERIQAVLELVNLLPHAKKPIHQFSGGMKRRLSLAIALLHEPEVLVLDEPTVGIDPVLRQSIWKTLNELKMNGTTIVVTTHVMNEAEQCERIVLLRDGRLIAVGSPDELKDQHQAKSLEEVFIQFSGGARA